MPRGLKVEGPNLPKGGYKRLTTKKKLAETAAFYAGMSAKMLSGKNKQKARAPYGTKKRGRPSKLMMLATAAAQGAPLFVSAPTVPARVKRTATAKQLAALAKARAARSAKKRGESGPMLAYGQYF